MPNIIAHLVAGAPVAETIANEADKSIFELGCILPDLVGMYGDQADGQRVGTRTVYSPDESPWLDRGVSWHYKTDEAYQRCPLKTNLLNDLETDFEEFGAYFYMGKAAIRGCAHAGTKIMLDGILMKQAPVRDLYSQVQRFVLSSHDVIADSIQKPIAESIFRYFEAVNPETDYLSPRWVADSLQKRFARRRGEYLAFPQNALDLVDHCFEQQMDRLKTDGAKIMKFVMKDLFSLKSEGSVSSL
jgi:hypothetical protein